VKQNEYALKHEALRHEATQAGLRGGGTETECSQDFSTRCFIPPVRTASPNLPGDAFGRPGRRCRIGAGQKRGKKAPSLKGNRQTWLFCPPGIPGAFRKILALQHKASRRPQKPPPFPALFPTKPIVQPTPLLLCCRTDPEPMRPQSQSQLRDTHEPFVGYTKLLSIFRSNVLLKFAFALFCFSSSSSALTRSDGRQSSSSCQRGAAWQRKAA